MKKIFIIVFLSFFNFCFSQNSTLIAGRILDEELSPLPGVQIFANNKSVGQTDFDGYYQIKIDADTKTLVYRFVGMATTPVIIDPSCNNVEVIMRYGGGCYLGYSQRKVDRIEKKRFKNLEKIYDAAFKQGLFKTEKMCGEIQIE